jgi:YbbR domain-containing protein
VKKVDNFLDNLMESKWFVRCLALILAMLLYTTAYLDQQGSLPGVTTSNDHSELIEDVPVLLYYDEENFVVTGAPQTVNLYVEGPNSIVQSTRNLRDFTVYLDLTEAKIGSQRVEFQIRDISDKLTVKIEPDAANVNVQEKVTKEFNVEAQFNTSLLEDGYTADEPIVEPKRVKVTGGKDVMDRISYVKAIVERKGVINETFTEDAPLSVLDQNLDKLNVSVEPKEIEVTVPVKSPQKSVSVLIKQKGTPKEDTFIKSIIPDVREITLYGKKSIIDKLTSIEIPVDVSNVEENQEVTIPIPLSEGIYATNPKEITVQIVVEKEESSTIKDIPIGFFGLNDNEKVIIFNNPENEQVDLTITGPTETLQKIGSDDFELSINVEGLPVGEHELDIEVSGPDGVEWQLEQTKVQVTIADKES